MRTFLLIGGSGFIGRHIAKELMLDPNNRVIIADRHAPPSNIFSPERVSYLKTENYTPSTALLASLTEAEVVMYLASTTIPSTSNDAPRFDIESNLIPLIECLEALKIQPGKRFIYASSGGTIYGPNALQQQSEDSPTSPICSYGIVKLSAEKYLRMYTQLHGVSTIALRIANPYGLDQLGKTAQGAIGVFIGKALKNETLQIWGDGSIARDYIWIEDVVAAFLKAADYSGRHACFNIGTGQGTTLKNVISIIEKKLHKSITVEYHPNRSLDVASSALDCRLAKRELSWQSMVSLEKGIEKMCTYALSRHHSNA